MNHSFNGSYNPHECINHSIKFPHLHLDRFNYLGEYESELDKARVRQNLGIADDITLRWGNIKGDIYDLKDLLDVLTQLINAQLNYKLNELIANFAQLRYLSLNEYDALLRDDLVQDNCVYIILENNKITAVYFGKYKLTNVGGGDSEPEEKVTLTLKVSPSNSGIVTGNGTYLKNTEVNISATPMPDYKFKLWSDGDVNATRKIKVTLNLTLTAQFIKNDSPTPGDIYIMYGDIMTEFASFEDITLEMLNDTSLNHVTKISPQELPKTNIGPLREFTTVFVLIPESEPYTAYRDSVGIKTPFSEKTRGCNGQITITLSGIRYKVYGELNLYPINNYYIYITKNGN